MTLRALKTVCVPVLALSTVAGCIVADREEGGDGSVLTAASLTSGTYTVLVTPVTSNRSANFKTDSLTHALDHLRTLALDPRYSEIEVLINEGTYVGEAVVVNDGVLKAPMKIRAVSSTSKPVFRGSGQNTFMKVVPAKNLFPVTIAGLRVERYNSAVLFSTSGGNAYQGTTIARGHHLQDCEFSNIGNDHGDGSVVAYAAVLLQNVQDSYVQNNTFENITSHTVGSSKGSLLHAIYAAHFSSNNHIDHNRFTNTTGDIVRVRNRSDGNVIEYNDFEQPASMPALTAVSFWFDQPDTVPSNLECPSFGNSVQHNTYRNMGMVIDHEQRAPQPACGPVRGPSFSESQNIDVSAGECTIEAIQDCKAFSLKALTPRPDFLSETSHEDGAVCAARDSAYYGSCSSRSGNPIEVYKSIFHSATASTVSYAGKGCVVDVQNCSRMGRDDFEQAMDANVDALTSEKKCLDRSRTWFASCSKLDPDGLRANRSIFVNGESFVERISGHGCLVKANYCPRMGFAPEQVRVDKSPSAHLSLNACLNRASSWLGSCVADGEAVSRRIEVMYYQHGERLGSRIVTN